MRTDDIYNTCVHSISCAVISYFDILWKCNTAYGVIIAGLKYNENLRTSILIALYVMLSGQKTGASNNSGSIIA